MNAHELFIREKELREKSGLCFCGKPLDNSFVGGHCNKCLQRMELKDVRKQHESDLP